MAVVMEHDGRVGGGEVVCIHYSKMTLFHTLPEVVHGVWIVYNNSTHLIEVTHPPLLTAT